MAASHGKPSATATPMFGETLRGLLPQLVPALIGTVGAVSLVAVVGGAVTWNRFNAAELPADQAVAALPQSELLAVGVSALIVFLLLGAGAVVVISQVEQRGPYQRRWALLCLVAGGMIYAILLVPNEQPGVLKGLSVPAKLFLVGMIVVALVLGGILLGWRSGERDSAPALRRLVFGDPPADANAKGVRPWLRRMCWLSPKCTSGGWLRRLLTTDPPRAVARLMMILFAGELVFAVLLGTFVDVWLGVTLVIGGVLGAICLLVGDRDRPTFTDYGLVVFVSVVVFGGATQAMQARYDPEVQPAAVIRVGEEPGSGLCGLYVTENDKRLYLARIRPDRRHKRLPAADSGRIFFVTHAEIAALSIGPMMSLETASIRASELRKELALDAKQVRPEAPKPRTLVVTRTSKADGVTTTRQITSTLPGSAPASQTPAMSVGKPDSCTPQAS
jgi:hypothetical protein